MTVIAVAVVTGAVVPLARVTVSGALVRPPRYGHRGLFTASRPVPCIQPVVSRSSTPASSGQGSAATRIAETSVAATTVPRRG